MSGSLRSALAALAVAVLAGCASVPQAADADRSGAAFLRLKALEGSWSGTFGMGGEAGPATVDYRVTGGGSAVEETLFRGTPHEMVTLYHMDRGRLLLTHYCAAGNQPTMILVPGDDPAVLRFDFLHATNMPSPDEGHMHAAKFDLREEGRLRTAWTYWENNQPGHTAELDMTRATGTSDSTGSSR